MKSEHRYLYGIAFSAAIVLWSLIYPVVPELVRVLVRFPSLDSATYLDGTFDFEGERKSQRYFVVNAEGRHEFYCGPVMARRNCFVTPERYQGYPAKVWYSYWYGSIQHELTVAPGVRAHPLDSVSYGYADAALSSRQIHARPINYWIVVLLIGYITFLTFKEVWRRQEGSKGGRPDVHG